ncbi:type II toxin-antitoxin system RelB/DinJ family antitoxin [Enterococcus timonensis]|uniref:type II toxin-antitoxin system RelB/DinJ family antitoxin n=1 Tax=Enterococcus timonensis TaxID=1852364 RepID=UPI0008D905A4|nr:type II toxin-antitoxin system RelB/DinJ family antitoxin [Enterococcus timonensis]
MGTTNKKPIHISVEANLKDSAEQLFNDLGLNMTTAITIFLKQSVANQAIPFSINKANVETMQTIQNTNESSVGD